jgi:predicted transcriptional regulator
MRHGLPGGKPPGAPGCPVGDELEPSENLRRFLFSSVDSAEQLEILLRLFKDPAQAFTVESLSREFRSSVGSAELRLNALLRLNLVQRLPGDPVTYRYAGDAEQSALVAELSDRYARQRHRILELVFSPMKKARHIVSSFDFHRGGEGGEKDG